MRKGIIAPIVALSILGCGGWDNYGLSDKGSPQAKKYEIQKLLDEGKYSEVISKLANDPTYGGAFSPEEGRIALAAAYIGRAGIDINSIINSIIESGNSQDAFASFLQSMSKAIGVKGLFDLDRAIDQYNSIASTCSPPPQSAIARDACFYRAIVDVIRAGIGLDGILDDLNSWLNPQGCQDDANGNNVADDGDASACAISYAVSPPPSCAPGVSYTSLGTVTFSSGSLSKDFEVLKIDVQDPNSPQTCTNVNTLYRLLHDPGTGKYVVLTDGYCDKNFNPCSAPDGATCLPCPVIDPATGTPLSATKVIIDSVTGASNALGTIIPGSDVDNTVNQYITEVCGTDNVCTDSDIANYLQNP